MRGVIRLLALVGAVNAATQIALFTDNNCQDSYKGIEGPNGYPNGSCTDFRANGAYGSLQVVGLDPGCGVTIYMADPNTTICGGFQKEIQLLDCYNSTYAYYSIDMCTANAPSSTPFPTPSSTSSSSSKPPVAALAGGIVGGLAGLALLVALAWWILRRKKRTWQAEAVEEHTRGAVEVAAVPWRGEVDAGGQRHEMGVESKGIWKQRAAEVEQPAVELAGGDEAQPRDGGYAIRRGEV